MKRIGVKITIIMLCIILVGITSTVGVATFISGTTLINESLDRLKSDANHQALVMNEWLSTHKTTAKTTALALAQLNDLSKEHVIGILRAELNLVQEYQDFYIGFPDNTAIMGSGFAIEELYDVWKASERGWYKLALTDTSTAHVTQPYLDTATGELCITVVCAVMRGSELAGVVGIDILIPFLRERTLQASSHPAGSAMLLDIDGNILVHHDALYGPNNEGDFKNFADIDNGHYADLWRQISAADGVYRHTDSAGTTNYYTSSTLAAANWYLVTVLPVKIVTGAIFNIILFVLPISAVILLLAALMIYLVIKKQITMPIGLLTHFMKNASTTGDIALRPDDVENIKKFTKSGDEIGECIAASAEFVGRITEVSKLMRIMADSDLTNDVKLLSDRDEMGKSLKAMIDNLNQMFREINASASQVSTGAKQVSDGSQSLAQGSTEQAASIEELLGSISEISEKTAANAGMAGDAAKLSDAIKADAEEGSRQMDDMIVAVKDINDASQSIGKIIKTIDDIAFQTNILALNAAVEAARAGQHGKGFAVVAEEVRNLATKSAEAAKHTGDMIANSMEKAELGSRIAGETAESLTKIASGINESGRLISEIARMSEEQSLSISQINTGIDQVSQVIHQNSATAEESAAASEEMHGQADLLQELISQFKLKGR